jgi:hypothetical protein
VQVTSLTTRPLPRSSVSGHKSGTRKRATRSSYFGCTKCFSRRTKTVGDSAILRMRPPFSPSFHLAEHLAHSHEERFIMPAIAKADIGAGHRLVSQGIHFFSPRCGKLTIHFLPQRSTASRLRAQWTRRVRPLSSFPPFSRMAHIFPADPLSNRLLSTPHRLPLTSETSTGTRPLTSKSVERRIVNEEVLKSIGLSTSPFFHLLR